MKPMPEHVELAFWHYVHQGPARSLARVARELNRGVRTVEQWSTRYQWRDRLAEWHGQTAEVRARAHLIQATHEQLADARDLAAESIEVGARLLSVVQQRLNEPLAVGPEHLPALLSAARTAFEIAQALAQVPATESEAPPVVVRVVYEDWSDTDGQERNATHEGAGDATG